MNFSKARFPQPVIERKIMALDSYTIEFFAWCKEGTSDKIWGFVRFHNGDDSDRNRSWYQPPDPGSIYNFWGRRGKNLSFKRHYGPNGLNEIEHLARKKIHPTGDKTPYRKIAIKDIENVVPGFAEEFENQLMAAKWSNAIKTDDTDNHTFF